jgi:hypothetical protein
LVHSWVLPALVVLVLPANSALAAGDEGTFGGNATDDSVNVWGRTQAHPPRSAVAVSAPAHYQYARLPRTVCGTRDDRAGVTSTCVDDTISGTVVRLCADGTPALDPLFRHEVDATGALVGDWEQVDVGGCVEDPPVTVVLTAADFRRLPLTPSGPSFQPADGRGLVNVDLVAFTDAQPQVLQTVVLGVPVAVRATPSSYAWDFGDGSAPLVTTEPGAPWPDATVGHPYSAAGSFDVQLTTTWRGEYQVAGAGPWLPVAGTATTVSPPFAVTVEEARAVLVADANG